MDDEDLAACAYGIDDGVHGVWIDSDGLNILERSTKLGSQSAPLSAVRHVLSTVAARHHPHASVAAIRSTLSTGARVDAVAIVDAIINDISGRRGLCQEWGLIDSDIQTEIHARWVEIVEGHIMPEAGPTT